MLPDKYKFSKKKTSVQKKSTNPDFNESFTYHLQEFAKFEEKTLEISVYCKTSAGGSSRVGSVRVEMNEVIQKKRILQWYHIIRDWKNNLFVIFKKKKKIFVYLNKDKK